MLPDADRSLANWLQRLLPADAGIRFECPDPEWLARPPQARFVDVFLHGIRQDDRGHQSGWTDLRDEQGRIVGRRPAAQYFRLAYLVTAWAAAGGTADQVAAEHELLGVVLSGCAHQGVLPDDCMAGTLAVDGQPTILECSPAGSPEAAGSLWSGLRMAPRPHLELVLVAPAPPPVLKEIAPPAREIVLGAQQAGPAPAVAAARGTADAQARPADHSFASRRRWEKQTTVERPRSPHGGS